MKKRRTKEQKVRAKKLTLNSLVAEPTEPVVVQAKSAIIQDVPLIKQDLRKTLVISLILVLMLIGIFLYLR